jgi:hypothetical protein
LLGNSEDGMKNEKTFKYDDSNQGLKAKSSVLLQFVFIFPKSEYRDKFRRSTDLPGDHQGDE